MSTDIRYFNVHTEASGYINGLKEITGKRGKFWNSKFTALEGNPEAPQKIFIDFSMPGDDVLDLLKPYQDAINADVKVFAVVRYAKFRGTPFVYSESSQNAGQLGINYSATLIKVMYLKVGDNVVFDHRNHKPAPEAQQNHAPSNQQPNHPPQQSQQQSQNSSSASNQQSSRAAPSNQGAQENGSLFNPPLTVALKKDDPQFTQKKDELKAKGYGWNLELQLWTLKSVKLSKDDPQYEAKKTELCKLGFRWNNASSTWNMAFQRPSNYSNRSAA